MYELSEYIDKGASFVTLTYDDEHLPKNFGLQPKDLQDFWKRLRKNLGSYGVKIKYRACGEYGDKEKKYIGSNGVALGRPHYHAIVYGLDDVNPLHREVLARSWGLCDPYLFEASRGKDSAMLPVCREDIAYVCGYVQKKLLGDESEKVYGDRTPPFSRSSQGLGLSFALSPEEKEKLLNLGYATLNGQKIAIPRYLRDKLGIEQFDLIKTKTAKQLEDENKYVFKKFDEHLEKLGLTWLKDDPVKNAVVLERRFFSWCDSWEDKQLRFVEDQYQKMRYIRGKGQF